MAEERIHSSDDKMHSKNRVYVEKSKEYLKAHLDLIDPECYRYLQENTSMELD
ncbi:TPA: hypothetical protein IAC10_07160 [Candidatus Scatousia excrementigallinarum]|uniref:Uncharacterized protein n=1 Tax=Candidatus Scatousia excrementigallinarum TaxID=2840935 RepID=A0A9D1JMX7_9BACT|nr:hypothetical protein [Candidatus Scatousia excrementigallinarum]